MVSTKALPGLATWPRGVSRHKVGRPARPRAGRRPWRKGEKRLTPGRLRQGRWGDSETWEVRGDMDGMCRESVEQGEGVRWV